jgi:hypothetical protein
VNRYTASGNDKHIKLKKGALLCSRIAPLPGLARPRLRLLPFPKSAGAAQVSLLVNVPEKLPAEFKESYEGERQRI